MSAWPYICIFMQHTKDIENHFYLQSAVNGTQRAADFAVTCLLLSRTSWRVSYLLALLHQHMVHGDLRLGRLHNHWKSKPQRSGLHTHQPVIYTCVATTTFQFSGLERSSRAETWWPDFMALIPWRAVRITQACLCSSFISTTQHQYKWNYHDMATQRVSKVGSMLAKAWKISKANPWCQVAEPSGHHLVLTGATVPKIKHYFKHNKSHRKKKYKRNKIAYKVTIRIRDDGGRGDGRGLHSLFV